jgi:hypothetical protein
MAKKKRMTAEDYLNLDPKVRYEETMRLLAECIVRHDPEAEMTADDYLNLDPQVRYEQTQRLLAERIVYHDAKAEEQRAAREKRRAS